MFTDQVLTGDCLDVLPTVPASSVDLLLTDPPFNIGLDYGGYDDARPTHEYLEGLRVRLDACRRVLTPSASLWLAIGARYQAELCVLLKSLGFHWRNTVVWHYTFGPAQPRKLTPSWVALHYFTVHPTDFLFNADAVRVPSARQLVYRDRRANPKGKTPDDVWVLRPQDDERFFPPDCDAWHVPRVAGTFRERQAGKHPCQMPLALLERIIRACSRSGDMVLDPYCGTGSTLVAARNLGRRFLGVELVEEHAAQARRRLERREVATITGSCADS